jgi:hypothetical protein
VWSLVELQPVGNSIVVIFQKGSNVSFCREQSCILEDPEIQGLDDFLCVIHTTEVRFSDSGRLDERLKFLKYPDGVQFQNGKLSVLDCIE